MLHRTRSRRAALTAASTLLVLSAGAPTAHAGTRPAGLPPAASPAAAARPHLAVGTWETEIDFGGGDMVKVSQAYTRAGELCHTGGVNGYGKGTWQPTGANTFSYAVVEIFRDDAGHYAGRAEMSGQAVQTGKTFRTQHSATVYDVDGNLLGSESGEIVFDRVSKRNPPCPDNPGRP